MVQRDGWKGEPRNDLYLFLGLTASNLVQHAFHPHAFRNVGSHNWGHCFERKNLSIERPTVGLESGMDSKRTSGGEIVSSSCQKP